MLRHSQQPVTHYHRLTSACLQEPFPSHFQPRPTPLTLHSSFRSSFPPSQHPLPPHPSHSRAALDVSARSPLSSSSSSSLPSSAAARRTFRRGALSLGASHPPSSSIFPSSSNPKSYASPSPPQSSIRPRQRSSVQVRVPPLPHPPVPLCSLHALVPPFASRVPSVTGLVVARKAWRALPCNVKPLPHPTYQVFLCQFACCLHPSP